MAFEEVKREIIAAPVLAKFSLDARHRVTADSSAYALGAAVLQKCGEDWRPVAFISRTLTAAEKRYAQLEKEALAITWACEKFAQYIVGKRLYIETDHKPFVPLLGMKHLHSLPPRMVRFRLRLMRFDFCIQHIPGKFMYSADTLHVKSFSLISGK